MIKLINPYQNVDDKTGTALFIYFQIFHRDLVHLVTTVPKLPLWKWIPCYTAKINVYSRYSHLIKFLCDLKLPKEEEEFYLMAQYHIVMSGKWAWVVPHLRATFTNLKFGDLYDSRGCN